MTNIMNANWDQTINEGTIGTAAKIGAVVGIPFGVYEGIKRHNIDERKNEEKRDRISRYLGIANSDYKKAQRRRKTLSDKRYELKRHKLDRKIRDQDRDLYESSQASFTDIDEGVAKVAATGLAGYSAYKLSKEAVAALSKKIADDRKQARLEHEYAFGESPEETARKVKHNAKHHAKLHESANSIMSRSW